MADTGGSGSRRRGLHFEAGRQKASESQIQKAVSDQLQLHPLVGAFWRMNVGAGYLISWKNWKKLLCGGIATKSMARFIRFAVPGFPDIVGILKDGRFLGVETKTERGRLSPDQVAFRELITRFKGVYIVARSAEDVMRHLSHDGK